MVRPELFVITKFDCSYQLENIDLICHQAVLGSTRTFSLYLD